MQNETPLLPPSDSAPADDTPDWRKNFKPMPNRLADRPKPEQPKREVTINGGPGSARWVKGMKSPNPAGRPPGIRERKAKIHEQLLDNVHGIMDVMIQKAMEGDAVAASLVVNRVLPSVKSQLEKVTFTLDADASISKQVEQVLTAISKGEVAPDVGKKIIETIQSLANVRAIEDLEQRITQLEAKAV
jgi:hypothetical protein